MAQSPVFSDGVLPLLNGVVRASIFVSLGLLLGRLAGLGRDAMIATVYGVGAESDVAVLLLIVPDLLVNILVGGALGIALIPEFKRLDPHVARALFVQASLAFGGFFFILAGFLALNGGAVVQVLAPGFDGVAYDTAVRTMRYVLWSIPFTVLAGVSKAYLHSKGRFGAPALGTLIFNGFVIFGLLFVFIFDAPIGFLALAIISGSLARWFSQLPGCRPIGGGAPLFLNSLLHRAVMTRYLQAVVGGSLLMLMPVVARALATLSGEGGLASLNFALKAVQFPLAICVTFLSVVLYPIFSERFAQGEHTEYCRLLDTAVLLTVILSICTTIPLVLFASDFISILFGYGRMDSSSLAAISSYAQIGFLTIPLQGCLALFAAAFTSRLDTKTPLAINALTLALFFCLAWWLQEVVGLLGVVIALLISYGIAFVLSVALLKIRHKLNAFGWKALGATVGFGASIFGAFYVLKLGLATVGAGHLASVAVVAGGGALVLAASLSMIPEVRANVILRLRGR